MKFYIVTPTFNNLNWLEACVRSVRDQANGSLTVHHHVQDGGSSDGTPEWLETWQRQNADCVDYQFSYESKRDEGMYHAINLAWEKMPADADYMAHLNSDEQYLPDALAEIAPYFDKHPHADVLLGTYIILDKDLEYLCHRRPVVPKLWSSWLNCACITNSSFFRASSFRAHEVRYNTRWKCVGDLVFYRDLIAQGARFATIPVVSSTFVCTGENLAWTKKAHDEWLALHPDVPSLNRRFFIPAYRWVNFKRRVADLFLASPREYALYHEAAEERSTHPIHSPTVRWNR